MKISKYKNSICISFEYNPMIVEIVKRFNNRRYDLNTKEWIVPMSQIKEVLETLIPLGFTTDIDARNEYDEKMKHKLKIKRITEGNFKESEIEAIQKTKLPLLNFQKIGTGFLCVTKSALLGDEPGCGKSIQTLATMEIENAKKSLIICPGSLKLSWKDEISKWFQNKKIVIIQGDKKNRIKQWKETADIFVMNYELLLKDIDEIKKTNWDFVVADEATRISSPKSKQGKIIKTISATHKIALTGTPLNNAIQDIWNILDFCQKDCLGSYWQFTEKYCLKDRFKSIVGYQNLNELKTRISEFMLRRTKKEVLTELPDKLYETVYVEFTTEEKKIYEAVKKEITTELKEFEINKVLNDKYLSNALVKMVRLRQTTGSLELISDTNHFSSKLEILKELLKDILQTDSKAIIFTQFSEMADILIRELKDYKPLLISGKVKNEDRNKNVKTFQENEENKIIIMTDAGAHGLNLQRSNYVIHYDLPWSISKMEQREGRAHRYGQKNNITVYKLIVHNSIDEYVLKVLLKKHKLSEDILGDKERLNKVKISKKDIKKMLE